MTNANVLNSPNLLFYLALHDNVYKNNLYVYPLAKITLRYIWNLQFTHLLKYSLIWLFRNNYNECLSTQCFTTISIDLSLNDLANNIKSD